MHKYIEEYQKNLDWLNKNGFIQDENDKDVFFKTYESGLEIEVDFNRDEDLYYVRPMQSLWLTEFIDVQRFEMFRPTPSEAVDSCLEYMDEIIRKIISLIEGSR